MSKNTYISPRLLVILFIVIIFASIFFYIQKSSAARDAYIQAHTIYPQDFYNTVKISAKSAYVFDYTDQKPLFEFHEDSPLPIASLAKLMSVPLALQLLGDNSTVSIPKNIDLESESDYSLKIGARWSSDQFADFTLLGSSDVGVEALQDSADAFLKNGNPPLDFIALMNIRAIQLGLLHTNFLNASGLDINKTQAGAIGTAHDMITLVGALLPKYSELFSQTIKSTATYYDLNNRPYLVNNTNTALATLSPLILSKTGYTDLAGGNLLIIYQSHGKTIGICVLGSTFSGRFADVIGLKNATEAYLYAIQN